MKKVLISIAALAAISTAAVASERNYDLRDSDTYFGKYSEQAQNGSYITTDAMAVAGDAQALTAFQRMMKTSEENEHGKK
jgi:uncharacterized protein YxeA